MNIPCITESPDLQGKTVLLRAGLNVPLKDGHVANSFRIDKIMQTVLYLQKEGARTILISHIGRDTKETLEPVYKHIAQQTEDVTFVRDHFKTFGTDEFSVNERSLKSKIHEMSDGSVLFLDNLRQTEGEKKNSEKLNEYLHSLAEIYVNEAFAVAHRKHSSTFGVAEMFEHNKKYLGITFHEELRALSKALKPEKPSFFILGGAKFETKLPMISKFIDIYDYVLIGGALLNNILLEKGYIIGESLHEDLEKDMEIALRETISHNNLIIPEYVVCETEYGEQVSKSIDDTSKTDKILDIAPKSLHLIEETIINSKNILWNGPLGYYEGGYDKGSNTLSQIIAQSDAYSIAGGGDTLTAIENTGNNDNFSFLSTGGGSTIEFLSTGTLPALLALSK